MGILSERPPALPFDVRGFLWDWRAARRAAAEIPTEHAERKLQAAASVHRAAVKGSLSVIPGDSTETWRERVNRSRREAEERLKARGLSS